MSRPDDPPVVQTLDYRRRQPRRLPATFVVLVVALVLCALVLLGLGYFATTRTVALPAGIMRTAPNVPSPGLPPMVRTPLPPDGLVLTVKQRDSAWLPGGNLKLIVDDITGGQVLVSIAAGDGTVVFGPTSMRDGEAGDFADTDSAPLRIEVTRLRNFLTGDDFGEFKVVTRDAAATRRAMSEGEKIELLLTRVGALEGATFIRNGDAHAAADAVEHLRTKWRRAGGADDPAATAEQFIEGVASRSSLSGTPYRIRMADGREVESGAWFREQLRELESAR